ncbi:MAG: glucose-6-phosphate isomerase, partial [Clostridium sp. CAG:217_53_7]
MAVKFNSNFAETFVSKADIQALEPQAAAAQKTLMDGTGAGNDFLGWVHLPTDYDKEEFARIKKAASYIQKNADVLIVIGIGGSYLGARAVIEALKSPNYNLLAKDTPQIFFIGNSIRYSAEEAAKRIFCTTDQSKGTLKALADAEGYESFVVPDNVGGRYSVLTAVGLLPIAVAGIDIDALMTGAKTAEDTLCGQTVDTNDVLKYAAARNCFYNKGKSLECFVSYEPAMTLFNEWLKQLFAESEGKDGKGLFPVSCVFSTDLHSVGQYIQESGSKLMFETVMQFARPQSDYVIGEEEGNIDGLNFLAGKEMSYVNEKARQGTLLAHTAGGVGNFVLEIDALDAENMGYMIYFFEKVCAVSGYMLGVNPFNQPGVESYKKNMFALLGKPGYESEKENLEKQLGL